MSLAKVLSVALVGTALGDSSLSLTVGTPGVSFHQVANYVVVRGLERLGYTVTVVDNMPHRDMYPMFTGSNGKPATIDVVTGTDLPYNHVPFLGPVNPWTAPPKWQPKDWSIIGTVNEATDIVVAAPAAASLSSTADLSSVDSSFSRTILGLDRDTCPACVANGEELAKTLGAGWSYKPYTPKEFVEAVKGELAAGKSNFVAVWYTPSYLNAELRKELVNLEVGPQGPWPQTTANQGKVVVRSDRMHKLTPQARNFLGAAYIGNKNIVDMDLMVNKEGLKPKDAADKWIEQHPQIFNMLLGEFNVAATEENGGIVSV